MKEKGNKKMHIMRQEIIDNPIPTSLFINPWHAYTARVTVVVPCVCVCLSTTIVVLQATMRLMSDINSFSVTSA